jgi:hypothetical protein
MFFLLYFHSMAEFLPASVLNFHQTTWREIEKMFVIINKTNNTPEDIAAYRTHAANFMAVFAAPHANTGGG